MEFLLKCFDDLDDLFAVLHLRFRSFITTALLFAWFAIVFAATLAIGPELLAAH